MAPAAPISTGTGTIRYAGGRSRFPTQRPAGGSAPNLAPNAVAAASVADILAEQSQKSRAELARSVRELRSAVADAGSVIVHMRTALGRVLVDYSALTRRD